MHKLFDNRLVERIDEVFANHQEAFNPGDWDKLVAKMEHQSNRKVIWLSYFAKAASVIILIAVSVFYLNETDNKDRRVLSSLTSKSGANQNSTLDVNANNSNNLESITKNNNNKNTGKFDKINRQTKIRNNDSIYEKLPENLYVFQPDSVIEAVSSDYQFAELKSNLEKYSKEIKKMEEKGTDSIQYKLYNEDDNFELARENKSSKKIEIGVAIASLSNYAEQGTGSNLNVGGGFSASWHFSKKISLSSGMMIARQSMEYNKTESSNLLVQNKAGEYAMDNSLNMLDVNTAEMSLEFVGIDIPLNLEFKHKRFVLTTGVSSLIYIQEKFNYSFTAMVTNTAYNYSSNRYETVSNMNQVAEEEKTIPFSHFDFARLVNIAVGYNIPVGKSELLLEPYIKLPVGNISSRQVKMGAGGLALKYYF